MPCVGTKILYDSGISPLQTTPSDPETILDGIKTLPKGLPSIRSDLEPAAWQPAQQYVGWAREALESSTSFRDDCAVSYAKRAACRRIDHLIMIHAFAENCSGPYPERIELLKSLGLRSPSVVHRLAIQVRNDLEHAYTSVSNQQARDAVEIVELFLEATREDCAKPSLIVVGVDASSLSVDRKYEHQSLEMGNYLMVIRYPGGPTQPFVVLDRIELAGTVVRLAVPRDGLALACPIAKFTRQQLVELLAHCNRSASLRSTTADLKSINQWVDGVINRSGTVPSLTAPLPPVA